MKKSIAILVLSIVLAVGSAAAPHRALAKGISLIRDAEIENTIRTFATPVFQVAGLVPDSVNIYLVNDNTLNAFVAGGQKLFMNTGLIMRSENANQIIGVIAHETGHIAGGHLSRTHDALAKSSVPSILAFILGAGATVATGRGDVGAAIVAGGQGIAMRNFLSYSRTQESAADHAAMKFLNSTRQSARGLLGFMRVLQDQELLSAAHQDPYVRTHPLSSERIATIENHVQQSPYSEAQTPPEFVTMFERMRAKLTAFIHPFARTFRVYKASDKSLAARYAHAIAYYRKPDMMKALEVIDGLIADFPADPYFQELKGQVLFENGRVREALVHYEAAARALPGSAIIHYDLGRIQLETHDPTLIDAAVTNLEVAQAREPKSPAIWKQLAIAHGRKGDTGRSSLALAEEALIRGKPDVAMFHAGRAEKIFPKGSREWLQAEDIKLAAGLKQKGRDGDKGSP